MGWSFCRICFYKEIVGFLEIIINLVVLNILVVIFLWFRSVIRFFGFFVEL